MFSNEQVTEAIKRVVTEAGEDYVYPPSASEYASCRYQDEHGGCIVGRTMRILQPDITFTEFYSVGEQRWDDILSDQAIEGLFHAQRLQDNGQPYGEALEEYLNHVRS